MTPMLVLLAALAHPDFERGLALRAANGKAASTLIGRAAEQGHPPAMFVLSSILMEGDGVPRNEELARQWLEQAAAQDYPEALQQLALHLQYGSGGYVRDEQRAAQLMRKAEHALRHRAHRH